MTDAKPAATSSASTAIIAKVDQLMKLITDAQDKNTHVQTEILQKLTKLDEKVSAAGTKTRSTNGTKKAGSAGTAVTPKFPQNSVVWFRRQYTEDPVGTLNKYFSAEQIADHDKHMKSDEHKDLQGDAKAGEACKFLWHSYVGDTAIADKIKADFQTAKESEKNAVTPASVEKQPDSGDEADTAEDGEKPSKPKPPTSKASDTAKPKVKKAAAKSKAKPKAAAAPVAEDE